MHTLSVIALVLVGLALPVGTAEAAAPSCQGHRATLVGKPGQLFLNGTNHRDVIVSNGAGTVRAGGGDDLVCVTGATSGVEDGKGDDVIDARRSPGAFGDLSGGCLLYTSPSPRDS